MQEQLLAIWQQLTQPDDAITDRGTRQRAAIFSGVMLIWLILQPIGIFVWTMQGNFTFRFALILIASTLLVGITYILSRTPRYRLAARIFIVYALAMTFGIYLTIPIAHPEQALYYMAAIVLVAGLALPIRDLIITIIAAEGLTLASLAILPFSGSPFLSIPLFIGLMGLLTLLFMLIDQYYQRAAEENEARLRTLMEANNEGIFIVSDEDEPVVLDCNSAAVNLLGFPVDRLIGQSPLTFIHRDHQDILRDLWRGRNERYPSPPLELSAVRHNGVEQTFELTLRPYRYQQQAAQVATLLDTSERRAAERMVAESEARFKAIFHQSFHYIAVLSADGRILELSDHTYPFFGLKPDAVANKYLWEIPQFAVDEETRERARNAIAQAATGEALRCDVQVQNAAGELVPFDFSIKPAVDDDGNVTMLIAECRDMSDYQRAEAKRIEYELRYKALFEKTADGVFIIDMDGIVISANESAQRLLGGALDAIIGRPAQDFVIPEEMSALQNNLTKLQQGNQIEVFYERRMRRLDGTEFAVEVTPVLVHDQDGTPIYIHSMVRDLAPRRQMEQQRFQIELERERTQLLQHFIEQASHHFRTPITNIKTSTYLLPRLDDYPEKRTYHFGIIDGELSRLTNLLDDLLSVLRLQKSDTEFYFLPIPMHALLTEIRTLQEGHQYYPLYDWQWDLAEESMIVIGDREHLANAILHIVENAVIYTPEGGKIRVRSVRADGWVSVTITDSGMGIAADDLPRIFDDFFRSHIAMERDSTSSGLGLTITRLTIDRHQGKINVISQPDNGTTFQILLPIRNQWTETVPPIPDALLLDGEVMSAPEDDS